MRAVLAIAIKDIRQLMRDRVGFFFVFAFPIIFGVLFGVIFSGGGSDGPTDIRLAVVDLDASDASARLVALLDEDDKVLITEYEDDESARDAVRTAQESGVLVIPEGFGEDLEAMFFGDGAELELAVDPSRGLEGGVIRGSVAAAAYQGMFAFFQGGESSRRMLEQGRETIAQAEGMSLADRLVMTTFLNSADSMFSLNDEQQAGTDGDEGDDEAAPFQPITIFEGSISRERTASGSSARPTNFFEVTFPQAIAWGLMSCVLGFGLGVVSERTRGTLTRLKLAPISSAQIMGGKALACFATCLAVQVFILAVGVIVFGVRPDSWGLLALGVLSSCIAFVGLAMVLASFGKTESASEGLSRAVLLVLALIGGAGVPLAVMPLWVRQAASISPFKWVITALDGAIWREWTFMQVLAPCAVLVGIGLVGGVLGVILLRRASD